VVPVHRLGEHLGHRLHRGGHGETIPARFGFARRRSLSATSPAIMNGSVRRATEEEAGLAGRRRRPRAPGVCVGIDLAGVEYRETGVAVLRAGRLDLLTSAGSDEEILNLARLAGRWGTVAVNAPLTRPLGRCCLDDDCPCRHDPGTRSRQLERELGRMRVPTL